MSRSAKFKKLQDDVKKADRRAKDLENQRKAGKVLRGCLDLAGDMMLPGKTPKQVDAALEDAIYAHGCKPTNKGYHPSWSHSPYPAATCIAINEEVVHSVPSNEPFRRGDIVTVDLGVTFEQVHADAARTFMIGEVDDVGVKLIDVAEGAFWAGVKRLRPGATVGDVGSAIEAHVTGAGFKVVRQFTGHGIGRTYHADPTIFNYGFPGKGPKFRIGQVVCIEPIICEGDPDTYRGLDGWTMSMMDGKRAAQFEHTVLIGPERNEILT